MFQDESNVAFTHNIALHHAMVELYMYMIIAVCINLVGNTKVVFHHNIAESDGGALYSYDYCNDNTLK